MTKERLERLQEMECRLFYEISDLPPELRDENLVNKHRRVRALIERIYNKRPELFK